MKTKGPRPDTARPHPGTTVIQTAKQAARSAGVRLYSREGLALAVERMRKGAAGERTAPLLAQALGGKPARP